jgi:hypothetical protein
MIKLCRGYAKEDRGRISIASRSAQEHGAKDTRAADGLNTTARYAWALKNLLPTKFGSVLLYYHSNFSRTVTTRTEPTIRIGSSSTAYGTGLRNRTGSKTHIFILSPS